jgi:hypothetical protein
MCRASERFAALAAGALLVLAAGCSGDAEGPSEALRADVAAIRRVMIADPAQQPLAEVERVAEDRPVLAGRLVRTGALPAARRQVEAVEGLRTRTERGGQLADRLLTAYRARVVALEDYAEVLEAAASDEAALLEALRAQSDAEMIVLEVDEDLEALAPTEAPRAEGR